MHIDNMSVIINLAATMLNQLQSQTELLTRENYKQLGTYNKIIAQHATDQQKKNHCYFIYCAYQNVSSSPNGEFLGHILFNFRRLCHPLLDKLESFIPATPLPNNVMKDNGMVLGG